MGLSPREKEALLLEIAESQQGLFTAKQAKDVGYEEKSHSYHVRTGNWTREYRGIYRLTNYPIGNRVDLVLWYLWSHNRQGIPLGVYSHQTALDIHELSDLMPAKLHMTVPKGFRKLNVPPVLVLHYQALPPTDTEVINGVGVTKPLRTVVDLLRSGEVSNEHLKQSLDQAFKRGLITRRQVFHAQLENDMRHKLNQLLLEVLT